MNDKDGRYVVEWTEECLEAKELCRAQVGQQSTSVGFVGGQTRLMGICLFPVWLRRFDNGRTRLATLAFPPIRDASISRSTSNSKLGRDHNKNHWVLDLMIDFGDRIGYGE